MSVDLDVETGQRGDGEPGLGGLATVVGRESLQAANLLRGVPRAIGCVGAGGATGSTGRPCARSRATGGIIGTREPGHLW